MSSTLKYLCLYILSFAVGMAARPAYAAPSSAQATYSSASMWGPASDPAPQNPQSPPQTATTDSNAHKPLRVPIPKEQPDGLTPKSKGLQGKDPNEQTTQVDFLPEQSEYYVWRRNAAYRLGGQTMSFDEYSKYNLDKSISDYWKSRNSNNTGSSGSLSDLLPALKFNTEDWFSQLFKGDLLNISFNGSAELILGFIRNRRDDPALSTREQRKTNLNFDAKIEVNGNIRIGNRFDFKINHNTEALFAFDNKFKLQYEGKEDEIIKLIQAGDIDFPLNTTLIRGSQNLFGLKTKLQFGKTFITGVFSEQRSESKNVTVEGGAQSTTFNFKADQYEEDRHYFLGHYFRDNYNKALENLPRVNSNINIIKVEVWVTTIGAPVNNNRNIVAFNDLGEHQAEMSGVLPTGGSDLPSNDANNLLRRIDTGQIRNVNLAGNYLSSQGFTPGHDFVKIESARRLSDNEFTFNPVLGFISLNTRLNADQVLAVAYQYQVIGSETVYQVGEFSDQGITAPNSLMVKLLKSSALNTKSRLWKLMMKNIYPLNAYGISQQDFRLNILYSGDDLGVPAGYFKEGPQSGIPLIRVFGMDKIDFQGNPVPDGVFDFLDNAATQSGLIETRTGRIYMPYIEPFGKDMYTIMKGDSAAVARYIFQELYENTKIEAQQYPTKNKFYFEGSFKSSTTNEISLGGMNIPEGSVKVTAGNVPLVENVDYTVDYLLGRVTIINPSILSSGVPINVSSENNSMYNIMTKRMMGLRVDHLFSKKLQFGGTLMNLHQSPITQKVNFGEEPISNTIWGLDMTYEDESRWLTKAVDAILPFSNSKTPSRLSVYTEVAQFIPGFSKSIGKTGTIYIDDFEGSKSTFNLRDYYSWYLASTPQWQPDLFPEGNVSINSELGIANGYNRAKMSWFNIESSFYNSRERPKNINKDDLSDHNTREILVREIFPNKELDASDPQRQQVLNLAFYPSERGPYNFDINGLSGISSGIGNQGQLLKPETRWAGLMRKIDNTDFEASNVEYIEFWLMDPFIGQDGLGGNPRHHGGKLYFNLGDISEDVLRDGRKSFENGFPTTATVTDVESTIWGRVPSLQSIVRAFDEDPNARQYQDIGYDGLRDDDEREFFANFLDELILKLGPNSGTVQALINDPANDNYRYFKGSAWDNVSSGKKILDRYKDFNNPQGNSPSSVQNTETYPTQQTINPNTEDINGDNTLNEAENYFQYEVDLNPDKMLVGEGYITDLRLANVTLANGDQTQVRWYQYKIPIRNPDRVVGNIQNFQSIRFMRMFMRNFTQETVLRFATLELVKSEWRKYNGSLLEDNGYITSSPSNNTQFNMAVVNIEENGARRPIPYVLPPGIDRQTNFGSINLTHQNEQSLSMRILDLGDGDARGIYKTLDLDLRQFKHLRMMIHAEKAFEQQEINTGELALFIRLGSDFDDNYYEYEMPLHFTPWSHSSRSAVWPTENDVDINLEELVGVKEARNAEMREPGSDLTLSTPYERYINGRKYTVVGSPSISAVKTVLIGVRNPKKKRIGDDDDGLNKSAEVWINELRVSDFNTKSGYAATARVQASLGDLGNVNVSGSYSTANFGQVEQRITELKQVNAASYDIATNLELGKFLPEQTGIRLPVHYDYSRVINNPEYNPLDPDVKTANDLRTYVNEEDRKKIKRKIQDHTVRHNLNFMNVGKDRTKQGKQHFYDVENLRLNYAFSSTESRNADIEYDNKYTHRGGFTYTYAPNVKAFQPLSKSKLAAKKNMKWLSDFNINYAPNSINFSTEVLREFNENKLQNKSFADLIIEPTYYKRFEWLRNYNLKWDIAKSILFDYSANANANITEPSGLIDTKDDRDSIWQSFFRGGDLRHFQQQANITWNIPINKLPHLDWLTTSANYNSTFNWDLAPPAIASLGNTLRNSRGMGARGGIDFIAIYNKVPYLNKINQNRRSSNMRSSRSNPNNGNANGNTKGEDSPVGEKFLKGFIRALMLVRNVNMDYRITESTILPGYMGTPKLFGVDFRNGTPGVPFVFGDQRDIRNHLVEAGLMSTDSLQNSPFEKRTTKSFTASALVEPYSDLKVQVNASMNHSINYQEFFKYDPTNDEFRTYSPRSSGNYQVTIIAIKTSFAKGIGEKNSETFDAFLQARGIIAGRLASENPHAQNGPAIWDSLTNTYFPYGYGPTSQEVLIPAFIAAYTGRDPSKVKRSAFPGIPLPNWSITFNGLTKIEAIRKLFNRVTLRSAYNSSYTIGNYGTNLNFRRDPDGFPILVDQSQNFLPEHLIEAISIVESFSPLIKIELELKNNFTTNFEFKKSRAISLSFANNQLTETSSEDYVVGLGYVFKDVGFSITSGGGRRDLKSDINVQANLSIRSNKTILRQIDQNINMPSAGSTITSIDISADYNLTENFVIKLFYRQDMNRPVLPNNYFNSTIQGGISLRWTISI